MKIVIDIPEHDKNVIERFVRGDGCEDFPPSIIENLIRAVYFGTPLEKHDEEIIKEAVESIWGKPPYNEVLDKIRYEIVNLPDINPDYPMDKRVHICKGEALYIIDKYRKGQTDEDSD